ncbi:hypothetical protein KZX37_02870 [Microbacterium sp. EYE_5]|uniref:DUF6716 putative glycosyltransferase n=1 Tax=unclassified Microbacterium TaxID=2609290 RepID=UPI002006A288|nr:MULTISPECIES: DUF6716 putative glycosyltransferase [unclassified Microbacterium]MCK6079563.1 hypothetical protein [Microbacterium sp. EYE_382]MCK6084834.1 hypothetical protein [Microbacterium sp. EYE_384]MCK6122940.1 hypothetical protein [Microbacterium sp. EYE_80]MCK6125597.1 hypothetical protein [Microbacterium sp. EYE_79]MCK6140518.1 hypothetical protein [Microbacterium sp. EYE_39]
MTVRGDRPGRLRVVAIADADSFVKWSAALIDSAPSVDPHLLLVRTPLTVSVAQEHAALAGTGIRPEAVSRVGHDDIADWLSRDRPDVVVIAGRGPFVRLVTRQIDRVARRPVVVSGLPGISIPAQRGAATYRRHCDLMVVHSQRELRAFRQLAEHLGIDLRLGLATLPYARPAASDGGGTDLVFAAQAIVPREPADRAALAGMLRAAALADPSRRVVVKLRSRPELGETETHLERTELTELLRDRPDNLVFSHEPMSQALARAEGLVTVSSTAAIEAMAAGVPVIALDTFGVSKTHLNTVFNGSGVQGTAEDVIARRFRHPNQRWLADNYFHDPERSTWWNEVERLVSLRRRGLLAPRFVPAARGGALHEAWQRKAVLGDEDRSVSGTVALLVGGPLVWSILTARRALGRRGPGTWFDDATDITVTPARYQDPIVRPRRAALVGVID